MDNMTAEPSTTPEPVGRGNVSGDVVGLGPFTNEDREHYFAFKKKEYLIHHPGAATKKVNKYIRVKWSRKLKKLGEVI